MARLRRRFPIALLMTLATMTPVMAAESIASEYRVKAVFLFNFTQFIEWPADAFGDPGAPFVIGVLGKDPFGAELDAVVRGERVANHPLVVERYGNAEQVRRCHILFIAGAANDLQSVPSALKGRAVLTVTDAGETELRDVMIRLVVRDSRVRMRINLDAAREDNLTISSKLLRPAELVGSYR